MGGRAGTVAVLVAVILAACAGDEPSGREQAFLNEIEVQAPGLLISYEDTELIEMGQRVCNAAARGASRRDILDSFAGMPDDIAMSKLAAIAVVYICPEYLDQVG